MGKVLVKLEQILVKLEQTGRNMIFSTTVKKNKKEILFIAIQIIPGLYIIIEVGRRFSL